VLAFKYLINVHAKPDNVKILHIPAISFKLCVLKVNSQFTHNQIDQKLLPGSNPLAVAGPVLLLLPAQD
jgi:hypothetical protein